MTKISAIRHVENMGPSALANFFASFTGYQHQIEQNLMSLELSPGDDALLNKLQQNITSIQQSLQAVGLDHLTMLTSSLNKLTQSLRNKKFAFETVLSDLILLAINDIRTVIERTLEDDERCVLVQRLPQICEGIDSIARADEDERGSVIKDALLLLDPGMEIVDYGTLVSDTVLNLFSEDIPDEAELRAYGVELNEDFIFFRSLSEPLETRANYWHGRSHRMLRLALKMNDHAGRPVDPTQLAAAIYVHDAGMALMPLEIINSGEPLNEEQLKELHQHPVISYELMQHMKNWQEAAYMVLQHHERMDGKGYPYGLTERKICEGAKILAIADAIDARTHERAHATLLKRPLLRAAIELGKYEGIQFSEYWVNVFKQVFQEVRKYREV